MKPLFENDVEWKKMSDILESWIGTPYKHLTMVKGRGADCTLFIGACWLEAGIITKVEHDYYPREWHIHTREEKVLNSFIDHWQKYRNAKYTFETINKSDKKFRGDLLTFATTRKDTTTHCSIYMGMTDRGVMMCHSINGRGVSYFPYGNFWERRLTKCFRVFTGEV